MGKIIGRRYRFVDDYKKQIYVGANGKSKQRITYIGQWVCPLNEQSAYRRIVLFSRVAVGVLTIAVIAAMLIVPLPIENKWYIPVTATALFPAAYAILGVIRMPNQPKPMERQRYANSFERASGASIACLIILGLSMITWIVCWSLIWRGTITASAFTIYDGAFVLCLLMSAAACFVIIRKNKEIKTELRSNDSYKPE